MKLGGGGGEKFEAVEGSGGEIDEESAGGDRGVGFEREIMEIEGTSGQRECGGLIGLSFETCQDVAFGVAVFEKAGDEGAACLRHVERGVPEAVDRAVLVGGEVEEFAG